MKKRSMIHDKCVDGDGRLPHDFEACRSAEVTCDLEQNITFIRRSKVRDRHHRFSESKL